MTIRVTVKNDDSRETAVISVRTQGLAVSGDPVADSFGPEIQLKGGPDHTGESVDLYVHSGQQIVVREISQ